MFFNNYCSTICIEKVTIGSNTMFGKGAKIYDNNHVVRYLNNKMTYERDEFTQEEVKIGNNCWITSNVTILKGVEIRDNVVIEVNYLIYKSIPSNTVVKSDFKHILSTKG